MTPERSDAHGSTVVGIGASAGGLAALKRFFDRVPSDSGLVFVVVVHLSPAHESHLAEVLQPHAKLPIRQVSETVALEPNHVYVIPPNANLSAIDSHLRISKLEERRQERAPVDHFFRTLAATHDGNAIAVILSGSGSDGTLGIKEIKGNGGLVIVQDPKEAEYDGMPQSAIANGVVDFILPVEKMADTILRYNRTAPRLQITKDGEEVSQSEAVLLQKMFAQLRAQTNRDFSRYKRSTVLRRVARRMQLNYIEDLPHYLEKLRARPEEVQALADDMLITVTHFFRDPEVFKALETQELVRILGQKGTKDQVRVWSVGCATGEEAYSLAMLLEESASSLDSPPQIQVFASDLHSRSLEKAREGVYPGDIAIDVSEQRLKRFFLPENGGYRVRKELRDLVVFAPHNLLGDPPFSRLDLVCCRNLLIYLEREIQRDVVELFHYALNPEGVMVLGSAEAMEAADLFSTIDKKLCIFRKRNVPARESRLPVFPLNPARTPVENGLRRNPDDQPLAFGRLHLQMLEESAPPSLLVAPNNRIAHLSENAGRYLIHPGGEPTDNVVTLVREELRIELQVSLQLAREKKQNSDSKPIPVRFDGHVCPVVLHVRPAQASAREGFVLIIFDEREPQAVETDKSKNGTSSAAAQHIHELKDELQLSRQRLQAIVEQYEGSQEEMKASNEEMQSTNEELRSTLEELETSKEELQSVNEELETVNQQNRHKVEELAQLSSDLQNLLSATQIATLFLDRELRILRFTPKLGDLFNIRSTDRGRPISDLTHRLGYDQFRADAEAVLQHLIPIEREVQDQSGRWYLTRVLPYRSADDRIEGIVTTFIDIDRRKRAVDALAANEERFRKMLSVEQVGVLTFDIPSGALIDCNDAFLKMSGYTREEVASGKISWRDMTPPEYMGISEQQFQKLIGTDRIGPYEKEYKAKDGSRYWMLFVGAKVSEDTSMEYCVDISDRKRAEEAVRAGHLYSESILETLLDPLVVLSSDLKIQSLNPSFSRHFGGTAGEASGHTIYQLGAGEWDTKALHKLFEEILPQQEFIQDLEAEFNLPSGRAVMLINARHVVSHDLIILSLHDITDRKRYEENLRQAEQNLLAINGALLRANSDLKDFSFAVSHDMQEPLRMVTVYTEFLARDYRDLLDSRAGEFMGFITDGTKRMQTLLNDLRQYWTVDQQKFEDDQPLDCNEALARAITYLHTAIEESQAVVTHDPLPTVRAAIYPLTLLFQNLLSNSIKYQRERVPPRIHVSAQRIDNVWRFSVTDNGIGIEPDFREVIFNSFKRLHGREYPGTGLGLAMCKRIVERYHGKIWTESQPGSGSTFEFTLPATEVVKGGPAS